MAQETMGMLRTVKKEEEKKKAAAPTTTATKKVTIPRSVAPVATSDAGIVDVAWKPVETPVQQPTVTIPQQVQQPVYAGPSVAQLNQMLAQQQERARIAELERARQASLSALQAEQATIEPQYAEARRQTRATSARGAQQFADYLASRGLAAGGGAALGETRRLGALQGALGGLEQQETAALGDVERRRSGIQTGFESDVAAARAGIQAQALQNAIEQSNLDRTFQAQQQQQEFSNQMNLRQLELQQQGFTADQAYRQAQLEMQQAGLTGTYQGQPTLSYLKAITPSQTDYSSIYNRAQDLAKTSPELVASYLGTTGISPELQQQILGALPAQTTQADVTPYTSFIEDQFMFKDVMGQPQVNTQGASQYINNLVLKGAIPPEQANQLRMQYNLPSIEQVIADVQRRNEANEITDEEALQELTAYGIQF